MKRFFIFTLFSFIFVLSCSKKEEIVIQDVVNEATAVPKEERFPDAAYFNQKLPSIGEPTHPVPNVIKIEVVEDQKKNTTTISFLVQEDTTETIRINAKEYNYLPFGHKHRFITFSNGNKIGALPIRDDRVKINAWSERWPINELFFIDKNTGIITPLYIDYGMYIDFLDSPERDICWVILRIDDSLYLHRFDSYGNLLNAIPIPLQKEFNEYNSFYVKLDYDGIYLGGGSIEWDDTFMLNDDKTELVFIKTVEYDTTKH